MKNGLPFAIKTSPGRVSCTNTQERDTSHPNVGPDAAELKRLVA